MLIYLLGGGYVGVAEDQLRVTGGDPEGVEQCGRGVTQMMDRDPWKPGGRGETLK